MARNRYIRISLNGQQPEIVSIDDLGLKLSWFLEDGDDFAVKKAMQAFDLVFPVTKTNDQIFNTFHNSGVDDNQPDGYSARGLMKCYIDTGGMQVLSGYAQLQGVTVTHRPQQYTVNCYGGNGDWSLQLQDTTLAETCNQATHVITQGVIEASWNFDGTSQANDYVYAPVRYRQPFDDGDTHLKVMQMRPAQSIYWHIYRGFKSIGYEVKSFFMDLPYFRRQVLPWTFGDFLNINSASANLLKFKALGHAIVNGIGQYWVRDHASIGSNIYQDAVKETTSNGVNSHSLKWDNVTQDGAFDNGNTYSFNNAAHGLTWTYINPYASQLGQVTATFYLSVMAKMRLTDNSNAWIKYNVYHNATLVLSDYVISGSAPFIGSTTIDRSWINPFTTQFDVQNIQPGDTVSVYFTFRIFKSTFGTVKLEYWDAAGGSVNSGQKYYNVFQLLNLSVQPGAVVDLKNYAQIAKFKWLDMLRGLVDKYDLSIVTDTQQKKVYIEPMFPYKFATGPTVYDGHFSKNHLDWTDKKDHSLVTDKGLFSDLEQQYNQIDRADANDGGYNIYKLRYNIEPGQSYFMFPERFKKDTKTNENRFFSPVLHVRMIPMNTFNTRAPQMIAMIPENVSNTSASEAETAFSPKLAYYKGKVSSAFYGTFRWEGNVLGQPPLMFAVNYDYQGHLDPILTYCNQRIDNNGVPQLGIGLSQHYFTTRFVMYANGQQYSGYFRLNNNDFANWQHRELIIVDGVEWYLFTIEDYQAVKDASTLVTMWRTGGVLGKARLGTTFSTGQLGFYPTNNTVLSQSITAPPAPDIPYHELLILYTDLPQ